MLVDADSPESLDEVFWRIFAGNEYIERERLTPHRPPEELIEKYVRYVRRNPRSVGPKRRGAIRPVPIEEQQQHPATRRNFHQAFPNALILLPFRQPLQQAHSLYRRHRALFSALQKERQFALSYMTWLCSS